MPLGNLGVLPSSSGNTAQIFNELTAVTRRAFIPRVTVQLYFAAPTLSLLMGGAQKSAGGVNQITFPVQGSSMVQGAWAGYSGSFNKPQIIPGMQNAQFNTAYFLVPVPLTMGEALIQTTEAIIPILDVRMNDVYAVTVQQMASAIFSNNIANPLMPSSFVDGFDNGTTAGTYGGINRNAGGNSFWKGQVFTNQGAVLTRQNMSNYLIQVTDVAGGEKPDFVVMSPSDFATLVGTFIAVNAGNAPVEQINLQPESYGLDTPVRSGFTNIWIDGVPFYMDHWCPKGTFYMVNSKYTAMYLSEDAPFAFSGFYSSIPLMQVAQVGVMLVGYNILTTKPLANAVISGVTGGAF